jgi:hypothetical protein
VRRDPELRWFLSVTAIAPASPTTHGTPAALEEPKAKFGRLSQAAVGAFNATSTADAELSTFFAAVFKLLASEETQVPPLPQSQPR